MTTTGSLVSFIQEEKARAVEARRDPKKAQEAVAVLDSQQTTLKDKVMFLAEDPSSIRVKGGNLKADLDEMTALVQRLMGDDLMLLSSVSTEG